MFELKNVVIGYHSTKKAPPINATLLPGPICFLFGANGSGKTSLLKTLAGILPPKEGEVLFSNQKITANLPLAERPAYLPSQTEFSEFLTAEEVLDIAQFQKNRWTDSTHLEKLALTPLLQRPASQLSSGEQKRLMIAATLSHPSPTVLLDEPLNALDWNFQFQLKEILELQIINGRNFVICNHDFNWALRFKMSQCWVLDQMSRLLSGETSTVLTSEKFQSTFHFRSQITDNPLDGTKLLALSPVK